MILAPLLAVAVTVYTPANVDDVSGPLRLRNEFPFQILFLSTPPLDARVPARKRLDVTVVSANTIALPNTTSGSAEGVRIGAAAAAGNPQPLDFGAVVAEAAGRPGETFYVADTETWKLGFVYTHPFGRRWLLEVEAPLYAHGGGFLDEVNEGWHTIFGLPDVGRSLFPYNLSQIGYARDGSVRYAYGQSGPGLGDVTLRGLHNLGPERGLLPELAVSGAVKLPTGDTSSFLGSGTWDAGVGLHLTKQFGQSWLYGTMGYNWHGGWRGMPTVPVRNSLDGHLGYEFRVSKEWSVVGGVSVYGSPLRAAESQSVNNPATNYGLAARYNDGTDFELEWGFIENIARNNNTHDFGLYSRIRFWP